MNYNYSYSFKKTKNKQETSTQSQDKNPKRLLEEEARYFEIQNMMFPNGRDFDAEDF